MSPGDQKVDKVVYTRRFLDKQKNPWEYVDEELPTTTIKLKGAARRVVTRTPRGTAAEGSYRITGSHYDFAPGTYSLRITRLSLSAVGSPPAASGSVYQWHLRHSRLGTIDVKTLHAPAPGVARSGESRIDLLGGPQNPIYAVGPGTLLWGWDAVRSWLGTQVSLSQSMEAITG